MRRLNLLGLFVLTILLPSCTEDQAYKVACETAAVSKTLYDGVADPAAAEMARLVKKHQAGETLTEFEVTTLTKLRAFVPILDKYAASHSAYVAALKVWEAKKAKPDNWASLTGPLLEFVEKAKEIQTLLNPPN